jgi:hypothetical protein
MSSAYAQQYKIQSPLQIPGCQLWLDGADPNNTGTLPANGATISTWTDKSGNARNFSGGVSPSYFRNVLNNNGIVRFSSGNYLVSGSVPLFSSSSSGGSFFFIFQTTNNEGQKFLLTYQNQVSGTYCQTESEIGIDTGNTTGSGNFGIHRGCSYASIAPANTIASSTFYMMGLLLLTTGNSPDNVNIFQNGNSLTVTNDNIGYYSAGSYPSANNSRSLVLGARNLVGASGPDGFITGDIAEVLWFSAPLSTRQRQQIEGYLAWKWGLQGSLPSSHPYSATNAALFGFSNMPLTLYPRYQTNVNIVNPNFPRAVSGLSMWFDAADRTSITLSGTNVSQWNDKSGKGNNLSAASARPTYTFNARNNLNVVTYDGTQNLTTGSISATNFAGGTVNLTTFVVFSLSNTNTGSNYSSPFCWANGGGTPRIAPTWEGTANGLEMDVGSVGIRTSFTSPALATNNTFYFLSYWKNGATTQLNVNGSNGASGTGQDTTNYGSCNFDFNVGNGFSNSQYWMRGNIGEIIFFSTTLNTTTFQQMEGYLAYKWGLQGTLPTSHPYFSSNAFNLSTFYAAQRYDKFLQQNKFYVIDSPLWFSLGIPTSNFSSALPIQLNGNTSYNNNILQLTPNSASQTGSAFYRTRVRITKWSTQFNLRFDSTQADGTTFCIQPSSFTTLGGTGGGLGYLGINNSVAIRFDTYNSGASPSPQGIFSTDILTGGTIPGDLGGSGNLNTTFGLTSNTTWNFIVTASYNGTTLSYTIQNSSNSNQSFTSNRTINIGTTIGSCNAFIGFTSATGGATEACSIVSWNWSNEK